MTVDAIAPVLGLDDVYGPDVLIHARIPRGTRWVVLPPASADARAAAPLPFGPPDMILVSAGSVTPRGLALMAEAGLSVTAPLHSYVDGERAHEIALEVAGARRIVLNHVHPPDLVAPERWWVPRELVVMLNDKAQLGALVPWWAVPSRRVEKATRLGSAPPMPPAVLKAVTEEPTGAGHSNAVCRDDRDIQLGLAALRGAEHLVVEEFLAIERSVCVGGVVMPDGTLRILGTAEEEMRRQDGRFLGSWLEPGEAHPSALEIARFAGEQAAARGFRGFYGVDVAHVRDGRILALDLNFRFNHSTWSLLLAPSLRAARGPLVIHQRWWQAPAGFDALERALRPAVACSRVLPLVLHDPRATATPSGPPEAALLVVGESRADVTDFEDGLRGAGLV